jgi:hypothetical protein
MSRNHSNPEWICLPIRGAENVVTAAVGELVVVLGQRRVVVVAGVDVDDGTVPAAQILIRIRCLPMHTHTHTHVRHCQHMCRCMHTRIYVLTYMDVM